VDARNIFTFDLKYDIFNAIRKSKKEAKFMRRIAVLALVLAVGFSSMGFAGSLTDKEQGLIASGKDQTRFERSYNLRDMRPNQFTIELGPPLYAGVSYSYNINQMFAIGIGAGSLMPGLSADMGVTCYILPTTIAPYATAGVVYYGDLTRNIIAANVGAGVDVAIDNGMGLKLGIDWVRSVSNAGKPFQTAVFNSVEVNWFNISGGLDIRW
jgi:hypothetical protein